MKTADLDIPIEVTKEQYTQMRYLFAGIVAHRTDGKRYWIKRLWPNYRREVEQYLNKS